MNFLITKIAEALIMGASVGFSCGILFGWANKKTLLGSATESFGIIVLLELLTRLDGTWEISFWTTFYPVIVSFRVCLYFGTKWRNTHQSKN